MDAPASCGSRCRLWTCRSSLSFAERARAPPLALPMPSAPCPPPCVPLLPVSSPRWLAPVHLARSRGARSIRKRTLAPGPCPFLVIRTVSSPVSSSSSTLHPLPLSSQRRPSPPSPTSSLVAAHPSSPPARVFVSLGPSCLVHSSTWKTVATKGLCGMSWSLLASMRMRAFSLGVSVCPLAACSRSLSR